jgi:hypothetical protein
MVEELLPRLDAKPSIALPKDLGVSESQEGMGSTKNSGANPLFRKRDYGIEIALRTTGEPFAVSPTRRLTP